MIPSCYPPREEIARLKSSWKGDAENDPLTPILGEKAAILDLFDRCQLHTVIEVCGKASSLSEAGRALFAQSRKEKKQANDADRLRKYLARFDLDFDSLRERSIMKNSQ